jgi:hypothetical protein
VRDKNRRPLQLTTPPRYYEHNIWLALETAIPLWATGETPVPVSAWPELPDTGGGIAIYEGRLRDLAAQLEDVSLTAAISALPRPNQAYWTLSALWAGWLWGREAIGPFTSVLKRQRYDWAWHTTALQATLENLSARLAEGTPFFGLITEAEPGFDAAAILGAELAELRLMSIAARPGQRQTQIVWSKQREGDPSDTPLSFSESAKLLLARRGEPAAYLLMQDAALSGWAYSKAQPDEATTPSELFNRAREELADAFRYQDGFLRYGGTDKDPTTGLWWLRADANAAEAISDRAEKFIVAQLLERPGLEKQTLEKNLYAKFPGLQTPPSALLERVLHSYADEADPGWTLKASDEPKARRRDVTEMKTMLSELGKRMGFTVMGEETLRWESDEATFTFVVTASAVFGETLRHTPRSTHNLIVLPGGRARLALEKLHANPHLAQMAEGWGFLKFRLARRMAENQEITPELFLQQVAIDPLSEESTQLPLF